MPTPSSPRGDGPEMDAEDDRLEEDEEEEDEEEDEDDDVDTMGPYSTQDECKSQDDCSMGDENLAGHVARPLPARGLGRRPLQQQEQQQRRREEVEEDEDEIQDDDDDEEELQEDEEEGGGEDVMDDGSRRQRQQQRRIPVVAEEDDGMEQDEGGKSGEEGKGEESDESSTTDDSSTDQGAAEAAKRARRDAALALQETVNDSYDCQPGRLSFRTMVTIPSQHGSDQTSVANRHHQSRGKKCSTEWVKDSRGYEWRIMYFPCGNNLTLSVPLALSLYLEINPVNPEHGKYCRRFVKFSLKALNFLDPTRSQDMGENHEFTAECVDWGFPRFLRHKTIFEEIDGFVYKDKIVIEACVEDIPGVVNLMYYDSKRETGMVGLRNQGATCYMNSVLQTLWSLRQLRMAVYDMPTENESAVESVALALQRVFFRLQTNEKAVTTKELTKAFGWEVYESFLQQDVQELLRVLCDRLEEKMKGTRVDGTIKNLFEGRFLSFTRCLHVEYVSKREESFYDVQLDVKGCGNLKTSFQKYIGVETLTGDNQYEAEGHGKQDAERGMTFMTFPPVLTVHLKRFEFDARSMNMVKINDRFEFPLRINLEEFVAEDCRVPPEPPGGPDEAPRPGPYCFALHSILVHSGDVHAGHYYAYIRPSMDPTSTEWFKFDDEIVTRVSQEEALEDGFGVRGPDDQPAGEDSGGLKLFDNGIRKPNLNNTLVTRSSSLRPLVSRATSSAYMLVYVREQSLPQVMRDVSDGDIPQHLKERFQQEVEDFERKQKENKEKGLYAQVEVVTEEDVASFQRYLPFSDFAQMKQEKQQSGGEEPTSALRLGHFKVLKTEPLASVLPEVSKRSGVPIHLLRLWTMCIRQNKTMRVDQCITMDHHFNHHHPSGMQPRGPEQLMTPVGALARREKGHTYRTRVGELLDSPQATVWLYLEVLKPPHPAPLSAGEAGEQQQQQEEEEDGPEAQLPGGGPPRHNLYAAGQFRSEEDEAVAAMEGQQQQRQPPPPSGGDEEEGEETKQEEEEEEEEKDGDSMDLEAEPLFKGTGQKRGPAFTGQRKSRRRKLGGKLPIEEAEERAKEGTTMDVLAFLEKYPPAPQPVDEIVLFFKRYAPDQDPPLSYKFARHLRRSMKVREMLVEIRAADPSLPPKPGGEDDEPDEMVEVYEEVTPTKVTRLKLNSTLEVAELVNGDIICYQVANPMNDSDADCATTFYNTPRLPGHVDSYFAYLVLKRRVHFKPYGTRDAARLQLCLESIKSRGLEVEGRCWVGTDKDGMHELVAEVSVHWPYKRFQEALAVFLAPVLDNPLKLRFYGCDMHEEKPSRGYNRALLSMADLMGKDYSPASIFSLGHNPYKDEVVFFEVLPFTMPELQYYAARDVVVNDARLRRACTESAANLLVKNKVEAGGLAGAAAGGASPGPVVGPGVKRPAPVEWTGWSTTGEPLVATSLLAEAASVGNVVESVKHLLGHATVDAVGSPRLLQAGANGKIECVLRWNQSITKVPDSVYKAMAMSENRSKLVLDMIDARELELIEQARIAKRVQADLVRRKQGGSGEAHGDDDDDDDDDDEVVVEPDESRRGGPEDGKKGVAPEDEEEAAECCKFMPIQVGPLSLDWTDEYAETYKYSRWLLIDMDTGQFASVGSETGSTSQHHVNGGGGQQAMPAPSAYTGCPLISFVERTDTLETLLRRVAPRIGEDVETLKQWVPRLILGSRYMYDWPKEENGDDDGMRTQEQQAAHGVGRRDTVLWAILEHNCSRLVNVNAYDVSAWNEVPSLTFVRAEPPQLQPVTREDQHGGTNNRTRRYDQGIKIREG